LWISNVWVKKEYRNKGIGKNMYDTVIEHCKVNNIKEIWLNIFNNNIKSIIFHEKFGFEPKITLYKLLV